MYVSAFAFGKNCDFALYIMEWKSQAPSKARKISVSVMKYVNISIAIVHFSVFFFPYRIDYIL
jgi:hypothetical protein